MRVDRLWLIGAALAAAILLAVGWFFLIRPEYAEATDLNTQAEAANGRHATLQRRLAELRRQNDDLDTFKDQLARDRQALPTLDAASDLLRQLQAAGEATGVSVTGISVGTAVQVSTGNTTVEALPINLAAAGPVEKLNPFLDQLQRVQPRAVLIGNVNIAPTITDGVDSGTATLAVNLQAFYAPAK